MIPTRRQTRRIVAIVLLLAVSPLFAAPAQPSTAAAARDTVTLNMHNAPISAVVQWLAQTTGKAIVLDPRVKGTITILGNASMSVDDAYRVVMEALRVNGYAAVAGEGVLKIVPDSTARTMAPPLVDAFKGPTRTGLAMYVVPLQHLQARELAALLKPLVAPWGNLVAFANNTLLVVDYQDNVKRIAHLARRLDATSQTDIEIVHLDNAPASAVVAIMQKLVGGGEGNAAAGNPQIGFAADDRSNSVLVSGPADERKRMRSVIEGLDKPLGTASNTRVFKLNYLKASDLVPVLKGVTATIKKQSTKQQVSTAEVSIEASDPANAIVVNAPPQLMDQIANVIHKLDVRRSQVLVEALIVEVSDDFAKDLGVEWDTGFSGQRNGGAAATNFGLISTDLNGNIIPGSGLSVGLFHHGNIRAIIRAAASDVSANILSRPSIVTLDNQEAQILVGQNVPFKTGQATSAASSVENPFTTIERKDIGLTLKITPRINKNKEITLDILQKVENITQATTPAEASASDLITNKRSIQTSVLVPDNDILVLGGLIDNDTEETVDKVPFLGDIPILGLLFRSRHTVTTKRDLMIFIQPTIIDDKGVALDATRKRYNLMREAEKTWQDRKAREDKLNKPAELPEFQTIKPQEKSK